MNWVKAAFVIVLGAGLTLWFGAEGILPLPDAAESFAVGIVGMAALMVGSVLRALGAVVLPLAMIARVLLVPAAIVLLAWLLLRRRA